MTRQFFPGAWYADALPSGAYCVLTPHVGIDTPLGRLAFPVGEAFGPLYLRCTDVVRFAFAGQAHDSLNPAAYEWRAGSGWRPLPPPCVGVSPLIYDRLGLLHLSDGSIGSQGWRFCQDDGTPEGQLVTGDATYGPFHGLSEYTALGDNLWIGQGHDAGGVLVFDGAILRVLEAGDGRFIRANRQGPLVAVAFMKAEGAVILQTSIAELRTLPPLTAPPIVKVPGPLVNQPNPEPVVMEIPDLSAVFASAVNAHPDLLAQLRALNAQGTARNWPQEIQDAHAGIRAVLLRYGAWAVFQRDPNFGLERKEGGTHAVRADGVSHAVQILMHKPTGRLIQVLNDTDPEWALLDATDTRGPEFWIQPIAPEGAAPVVTVPPVVPSAPPVAPPAPVAPPVDLSGILSRLAALEGRVKALEDKPAPVATPPPPTPSAPRTVKTSMVFGHSHTVTIP